MMKVFEDRYQNLQVFRVGGTKEGRLVAFVWIWVSVWQQGFPWSTGPGKGQGTRWDGEGRGYWIIYLMR